VGDGIAPEPSGWPEGQPNTKLVFAPYVVLRGGTYISSNRDIPLCSTIPFLMFGSYTLVAYHNSRASSDAVAAIARSAVKRMAHPLSPLGDMVPNEVQVYIDTVAGATRDDSVYPQMWSASTNFRIAVARA